jgi:hypothetical protein
MKNTSGVQDIPCLNIEKACTTASGSSPILHPYSSTHHSLLHEKACIKLVIVASCQFLILENAMIKDVR